MKGVFSSADILLPKKDHKKWAVVACDQFTSQPEYWEECDRLAGDAPSALRLILPEAFLTGDDGERIARVNSEMERYLDGEVFDSFPDSMIYVERETNDGLRRGVVGAVRLADYDYRPGSGALIRATEQTVLERIPPRVEIRRGASLELPHVMLLIDDPNDTVIGPLAAAKDEMKGAYDFDLMQKGGHIEGRFIPEELQQKVCAALEALRDGRDDGLLFAVGDGNHSLASAKECAALSDCEAAQYALVEVVNIHDESLIFEPIYRVVAGVSDRKAFCDRVRSSLYAGDKGSGEADIAVVTADGEESYAVKQTSKLTVGTLQELLDRLIKEDGSLSVDYIHGEDVVRELCKKPDCVGFLFEGMRKDELFDAVVKDGCLPRKTFSMGHASDKRYYMEARRIK